MLDKNRSYGEVYGHHQARYYQDGLHYTGNGVLIGKNPDAVESDWGKDKPAKSGDAPPPDERALAYGRRLAEIEKKPAAEIYRLAVELAKTLPDVAKKEGFDPVSPKLGDAQQQAENKQKNAEFIARHTD